MEEYTLSAFADEIHDDLKVQMDTLDNHGIKYIEMRKVNGEQLINYSLNKVKEIRKQLDDRGFKISAIGSSIGKINIQDEFDSHLDLFKHTLEIAHIMNTKYIRMFSFKMDTKYADTYRDEVLRRWNEFVIVSKGSGIILAHENEKNIYGDTAIRCLDLIETLNCDYVKAVFDPANFVQCKEEAFPNAYNLLKEHIEYLHIKDALYSNDMVVPAGMGDGKLPEILSELKVSGFKGFLSIEPHLDVYMKDEKSGIKRFDVAVKHLKSIVK